MDVIHVLDEDTVHYDSVVGRSGWKFHRHGADDNIGPENEQEDKHFAMSLVNHMALVSRHSKLQMPSQLIELVMKFKNVHTKNRLRRTSGHSFKSHQEPRREKQQHLVAVKLKSVKRESSPNIQTSFFVKDKIN